MGHQEVPNPNQLHLFTYPTVTYLARVALPPLIDSVDERLAEAIPRDQLEFAEVHPIRPPEPEDLVA